MKAVLAVIFTAVLLAPVYAGQPKPAPAADPAQAEILKKLERHVDFDFVETPFDDVVNFLNQLIGVNMVTDPAVVAAGLDKTGVTIRMKDTPMIHALNHITALCKLRWEIRDNAIFITTAAEALEEVQHRDMAERRQQEEAQRNMMEQQKLQQNLKLRVKLADGTEIQASNLNPTSEMAEQILDQFTDPASNGLLTFRLPKNLPPGLTLEDIKAVIKKVAPKAELTVEEKVNLMLVSDDDKIALRRVGAVMRELGLRRRMGPPLPPPGMGDGMFFQDVRLNGVPPPPPPVPQEPKKR